MRSGTDMEKVRQVARTLLHLDIHPTSLSPMVVSHPFTNSGFVGLGDEDGNVSIGALLEDPGALSRWRQQVGRSIDRAVSPWEIALQINTPYLLAFIKYTRPYLSEPDLGHLLAAAWTMDEAPNQDPNLSHRSLADLFRSVSPKYLMDAEELQQFQMLEDPVTVYRGVTSYNAQNIRALSWTLDRNTAEWFAHRFGEDGTVYEAQIAKAHIFALFLGRNESEVVVDPQYLEQVMEVSGPQFGIHML